MPRRSYRYGVLCACLLSTAVLEIATGQEPAPLPETRPPADSPAPASVNQGPHSRQTLIRGTIFSDKALALPGVQLRFRRVGEKKFRWERYSNSRGEFGVFVPHGSSYEMVAHLKGFADSSQTVEAKIGAEEERLVVHMVPATGGRK